MRSIAHVIDNGNSERVKTLAREFLDSLWGNIYTFTLPAENSPVEMSNAILGGYWVEQNAWNAMKVAGKLSATEEEEEKRDGSGDNADDGEGNGGSSAPSDLQGAGGLPRPRGSAPNPLLAAIRVGRQQEGKTPSRAEQGQGKPPRPRGSAPDALLAAIRGGGQQERKAPSRADGSSARRLPSLSNLRL